MDKRTEGIFAEHQQGISHDTKRLYSYRVRVASYAMRVVPV
jgi:hypothetical protein